MPVCTRSSNPIARRLLQRRLPAHGLLGELDLGDGHQNLSACLEIGSFEQSLLLGCAVGRHHRERIDQGLVGIENAPNEALVNALAMMSPYGAAEKQALLEAPDLKTRAEILVAVTEIELAKKTVGGETPMQ